MRSRGSGRRFARAILVTGVCAAGAVFFWTAREWRTQDPRASGSANAETADPMPNIVIRDAAALGSPAAPVVIVEFGDFQCPSCALVAQQIAPPLKARYVDEGLARWVYMHLPLAAIHPFAVEAAQAAECAGTQGRFWELYSALFARQALVDAGQIRDVARDAGIDGGPFDECLARDVPAKIAAQVALAYDLRIGVTPTFLVGIR